MVTVTCNKLVSPGCSDLRIDSHRAAEGYDESLQEAKGRAMPRVNDKKNGGDHRRSPPFSFHRNGFRTSRIALEINPPADLDNAPREGVGNPTEVGAIDVEHGELLRRGDPEVGAVESVEGFETQLEPHGFRDIEAFGHGSVNVEEVRPVN